RQTRKDDGFAGDARRATVIAGAAQRRQLRLLVHCIRPDDAFAGSGQVPASVESMIASGVLTFANLTSVRPRYLPSSPAGTAIGPGELALPGSGCGNAVERAVWKDTLPSTFCMI